MTRSRTLKTVGIILLVAGLAAAVGTFVVRDQLARHRRNLFSPYALRRFAALGYIAGLEATVELVQLLRDFLGWEPHRLLRRRAAAILARMENQLQKSAFRPEIVG
ncbi:MAG TPA: hypothetical protein VK864_06840 [Longimicrobiales bacterium]|nr:hypothetical protein [Longimicrobiales bacterium]